ncbi:MAG: YHYH protein [Bacteroidota bacterium]
MRSKLSLLSLFAFLFFLGCGEDEDPTPESFSGSVSVILSPESVEEGGLSQMVFTLSETNTSDSVVAVGYTVGGSASEDDYTQLTGVAIIPVGQSTTSVSITTIDDSEIEETETIAISIDQNTSSSGVSPGSPNSAQLTILDNDVEPVPQDIVITIAAETDSLEEGQSTVLTVFLSQPNNSGSSLSMTYTIGGQASNGEDYDELSGTVEVTAGSLIGEINLSTIDDDLMEAAERVVITLTSNNLPSGFVLGSDNSAAVVIQDNDAMPGAIVTTISASATGLDEAGSVAITIDISSPNDTGSPLNIAYTVTGNATAGIDYIALSGSVSIPNGEQSSTFDVVGIDDTDVEGDETITIELSSQGLPQGYIVGSPASVELQIMDDDNIIGTCSGTADTYAIDLDPGNCTIDIQTVLGVSAEYNEQIAGGNRTITTNTIPNHNTGQFPNPGNPHTITAINSTYTVTESPSPAGSVTGLTNPNNGAPLYRFGVLYNGILLAPIANEFFTNTQTGDNNTDWNENALSSEINLGTDCNNSHVFPTGMYHHHATPSAFIETLNIDGTTPVQIGWAADGYPIYYKYGNMGGAVVELTSGYQLKTEDRGGDGISAPSGCPDGTYTQDYEYSASTGDLDECNGYQDPVLGYIYVMTDTYPSIPRCFMGDPSNDFTN